MVYKHVFFDLDDTLWDFQTNAKNSLHTTYDQLHLARFFSSFDDFFRLYTQKNNELWDLYGANKITKDFLKAERFRYPLRQVGAEPCEVLAGQIGESYLDLLPTRTKLVTHAKELLDYLHEKYTLSIVSNGFVEVQRQKIRNSGIAGYFAQVVLSEEAGALKPDKRIFDYALRLNRARPEETIMIGDRYPADIVGAQNAGIDQLYFNRQGRALTPDERATYTVSSLDEVFGLL